MNAIFDTRENCLTWAEIDLQALKHNIHWVRNKVGNNVKICFAGAKSDGYGYGMLEVSRAAIEAGVDSLGVAVPCEGVALREAGIEIPVLIFSSILPEMAWIPVENNLTQTVCTYELCKALSDAASERGTTAKVHLKIDTGMGRIGINPEEAPAFLLNIMKLPNIFVEGVYTHLSSVGRDDVYTDGQIKKFTDLIASLHELKIDIPIKHMANSGAVKLRPDSYMDMVRIGSNVFNVKGDDERKPVFSLKSRVVFVKNVSRGSSIGYRRNHITQKNTRIATIPCGYSDGLYPILGNSRGKVIIRGNYYPVVGVVCSDQAMIDLGGNTDIRIGDEVVIIGEQEGRKITLPEVFELIGFFNVIAPGMGEQVKIFYK